MKNEVVVRCFKNLLLINYCFEKFESECLSNFTYTGDTPQDNRPYFGPSDNPS